MAAGVGSALILVAVLEQAAVKTVAAIITAISFNGDGMVWFIAGSLTGLCWLTRLIKRPQSGVERVDR